MFEFWGGPVLGLSCFWVVKFWGHLVAGLSSFGVVAFWGCQGLELSSVVVVVVVVGAAYYTDLFPNILTFTQVMQ